MLKLHWPELLPAGEIHRFISLDVDLYPAHPGALANLWTVGFSKFEPGVTLMAASIETGVQWCKVRFPSKTDLRHRGGLAFGINSGVVLIDFDAMFSVGEGDGGRRYVMKPLAYSDQSAWTKYLDRQRDGPIVYWWQYVSRITTDGR